MLWNKI